MNIGKNNRFHQNLWLIILGLLFASQSFAANTFRLNDFYKQFTPVRSIKVSYMQKRYFNFSKRPVVSSGYLTYRAPDFLAQTQTSPKSRKLVAASGRLYVIENGSTRRNISMRNSPNTWVMIHTLKDVLSGRVSRLQRLFKLQLHGKKSAWILTLYPKQRVGNITGIRITGRNGTVNALTIRYGNGNLLSISLGRR